MSVTPQDPATILIIDGDPLTLTALAATLHLGGHECHCARDCEAAIKAVRGLKPDLIICDVDLKGESGLQLCRELKQDHGQVDTPVLFLSAAEIPDIVQQTRAAGGSYYLRKPFDPDVLVELVEKALWMPHLVNTRVQRMHGCADWKTRLRGAPIPSVDLSRPAVFARL